MTVVMKPLIYIRLARRPAMAAMQACGSSLYRVMELRGATASSSRPSALSGTPLVFPVKHSIKIRSISCRSCSVSQEVVSTDDRIKRRQVILGAGTVLAMSSLQYARAENVAPKGYKAVIDQADGYVFYYPFGWEEIIVQGQDVVYKDVIEPLESVSVSIVKTDKTDLHEFGPPEELSKNLVEKYLTTAPQKAQLIEAKERDTDGKPYYTFEFLAKAPNYTRHALGAVTVGNGKFYALVTGANERRWRKMQDRLQNVVNSFKLLK